MGHGDGFQILIQQSVAPGKPILMNHWVQERLNVPRNKLSSLLPYSPAQEVRETPRWALELSSLFDEMAFVRNAETGPELDVDVSYIHHVHFPECIAPHLVRLDNLWYADLCTVWFDHIAREEPMRVLIVRPCQPTLCTVRPLSM